MAQSGAPQVIPKAGSALSRTSSTSTVRGRGKRDLRCEPLCKSDSGEEKLPRQRSRTAFRQKGRLGTDAFVSSAWDALVNAFAECHYVLRQNEEGLHPLCPPLSASPSGATGGPSGVFSPLSRKLRPLHAGRANHQALALTSGEAGRLSLLGGYTACRSLAGRGANSSSGWGCEAVGGAQATSPFAAAGGYLAFRVGGHGDDRKGAASAPENANAEQVAKQLLQKQRTRQGVLSEAEILDRLTNQNIAEIQYEFAARNGEVDVVEFIHILGRRLRESQDADTASYLALRVGDAQSRLAGWVPPPSSSVAGLPPRASGKGGLIGAGGCLAASDDGIQGKSATRESVCGSSTAGFPTRGGGRVLNGIGEDRKRGLCLLPEARASEQGVSESWVRGRGSVYALQDYHEAMQRELEEGGRLMELFDLIDVDDTQKVSWEAFTSFVVDRGRNEDALKRLHTHRVEKADFHDPRVHVCPVERLALAYDPAIGLDAVFYCEEGSKTVELADPFLQPLANLPPLPQSFSITALAYCPLVHQVVVAAADLSLTFYDVKGTLAGSSGRGGFQMPSPCSPTDLPPAGSPRAATRGGHAERTRADPLGGWHVTRKLKTRTSQTVLFPSSSRPWLFSADHEGSIFAWDLQKICGRPGGSAGVSEADVADPLAGARGTDSPRSRTGIEDRAIDLASLVPPSGLPGLPLHLPRLAGGSSAGRTTLSPAGGWEYSTLGTSPGSGSFEGRSPHTSGRSSFAGLVWSDAPEAGPGGLAAAAPAYGTSVAPRQQPLVGGKSEGRVRSAAGSRDASLARERSALEGVSSFESFTDDGRPSIVVGSRRPRHWTVGRSPARVAPADGGTGSDGACREHLLGGKRQASGSTSQSLLRGPCLKSRPTSPESASDAVAASRPSSSGVSTGLRRAIGAGGEGSEQVLDSLGLFATNSGVSAACSQKSGPWPSYPGTMGRICKSRSHAGAASSCSGALTGTSGSRSQSGGLSASAFFPHGSLTRRERESQATPAAGSPFSSSYQNLSPMPSEGARSCADSISSPGVLGLLARHRRNSAGGVGASSAVPQEPQGYLLRWRQYRAHGDIVTALEELQVMELLASCGMDGKVYLWDANSGELKRRLDGHARGVRALCFDSENRVLLSGGFDYKLLAWNPYVGKKLHTIRGHSAPVVSICMLGVRSRQFVSFDSEGIVKAWDLSTSACLQTLVTDDLASVRAVVALPQHRALVSAGRRLVALTYGRSQEASGSAGSGGGSGSGASRLSGRPSWDARPLGTAKKKALGSATCRAARPRRDDSRQGGREAVLSKAIAHLVVRVLVTVAGRQLRVWDLCRGALVSSIEHVCEGPEHTVSDICMDEKGRKVFVADQQGCICAYSVCTGQLLQRFRSHQAEVAQLLYVGGEDKNLISVSWDRSIIIHDDAPAPSKTACGEGAGHPSGGLAAAAASLARASRSASPHPPGNPRGEGREVVDSPAAGQRLPRAKSPGAKTRGLHTPAEKGCAAQQLPSGDLLDSLVGRSRAGAGAALRPPPSSASPAGKAGAGVSARMPAERNARVWRMVKNAHLGDVTCCTFSRRLGLLATGSADCAIFVWDYERLRRVTSLFGHKHDVTSLAFVEPLPLLCSADAGGTLCVWVLPPHPHAIQVLETLSSPLLGPQPSTVRLPDLVRAAAPLSSSAGGRASRAADSLGERCGEGRQDANGAPPWKADQGVATLSWVPQGPRGCGARRGPLASPEASAEPRRASSSPSGAPATSGETHASTLWRPTAQSDEASAVMPGEHGGPRGSTPFALANGAGDRPFQKDWGLPCAAARASRPASSARGGADPLATLLLVRMVDMERVGSTTALTSLAVACRMHSWDPSGAGRGRTLRFADSTAVAASPSVEETEGLGSGHATPPLSAPLAGHPAVRGGESRPAGPEDASAETPGVPHSTTFLTSSDGSDPLNRREGAAAAVSGRVAPWAPEALIEASRGGGKQLAAHAGARPTPAHGLLLRSSSEERRVGGEILIFAGDEQGRVRAWDVSVLLALLPDTEPVTAKTDWQPHRVYHADLRDSTVHLFQQVIQLQRRVKFLDWRAAAAPSGAPSPTPPSHASRPESPERAPPRLLVGATPAWGSAARGGNLAPVAKPSAAGEQGDAAAATLDEREREAAGSTSPRSTPRAAEMRRNLSRRKRSSVSLGDAASSDRDSTRIEAQPPIAGRGRLPRAGARGEKSRDAARSSEAAGDPAPPELPARSASVWSAGGAGGELRASVSGGGSPFARGAGGSGGASGGSLLSRVGGPASPYPGGGWWGEAAAGPTVDPLLSHDEIPALFAAAPVKLVGLWQAHGASVKSLQLLHLGSFKAQKTSQSEAAADASGRGASGDKSPPGPPPGSPSKPAGASPRFKMLLVSAGEDGAARVWDVSGLSPSQGPPLRALPTLFLDLAEAERAASGALVAAHVPGVLASAPRGYRESFCGDAPRSCLSLQPDETALALPPAPGFRLGPRETESLRAAAAPALGAGDPSAPWSSAGSGACLASSFRLGACRESSAESGLGPPCEGRPPITLVGDLQTTEASGAAGAAARRGAPVAAGERGGCEEDFGSGRPTLWNVDLGELEGLAVGAFMGNGTVAPAVSGARRLLETHMRVKELARQQQLAEQQAALQLESSLQLDVPHLFPLVGRRDSVVESGGRDASASRKSAEDPLPEDYAVGPNGQLILGGGNWIKGADKGGGIWAAVYAKRRTIVERTASF
ncbi:hypothetical protein BESB_040040 [Besnoitia besnoiti]|uniref:EF-hand domain-containing protein n=1 Tax=Besnoitia besnoiti TaxID=94643 RepID=A0A2A9MN13_BESBE|nr:hypothetical protein BESB_040040 [Besnoitia besnoiti]PFH37546.1 hypothetical protein BESB_040040 [Besnoitia besnoiti]